jgi:mannose-6-phosphate isomerase-like protein (cupin superfamily)
LNDIYQLFGISDRKTVLRDAVGWGTTSTIAKRFVGNVRLLTIEPKRDLRKGPNREHDTFLYFVSGSAVIQVGDRDGTFGENQYIFIPRLVGFSIKADSKVIVLELSSGGA